MPACAARVSLPSRAAAQHAHSLLPSLPLPLPANNWLQSYLTGLGGNTLLLSYFASKFEKNAVVVQALGIASSFAVLTQIRVAGFMPRAVYAGLAVVVGLQVSRPPASRTRSCGTSGVQDCGSCLA